MLTKQQLDFMKKTTMNFWLCAGISAGLSTNALAQKKEAVTYEVKPNVSSIQWIGKKLTGEHSGTIMLKNGKVEVADGKLISGVFEIDMPTINVTDMEGEYKTKLEGHLKNDDFFGTDKFPVSKLEITKAIFVKDKSYNMTGNLTIKGITNEISFPATVDIEPGKLAGFADLNIDRTKYGIKYASKSYVEDIGDKMIYDEFNLKVKIGAVK